MEPRRWATQLALIVCITSIGVIGAGAAHARSTIRSVQQVASITPYQLEMNTKLIRSTSTSITSTSTNCKSRKVSHVARFDPLLAPSGGVAYSITLRGNWCWRRGKVTSVSWSKDFAVGGQFYNFWEWVGWENTVTGGGVGEGHVYRRIKGHFRLCYVLPGLPLVCNHDYPWASMTLRGDGTSSVDSGVG